MLNKVSVEIPMSDGTKIYGEANEIGATQWVIVTHGIGEHLGRHQYFHNLLGGDVNLFHYDLRGHGKSGGKRGDVDYFGQYMEDLVEIIKFLKNEYKMRDYSLFGHSMGGLITAAYLKRYRDFDFYPSRVFLSAPPVSVAGPLGQLLKKVPNFVNKLSRMSWGIPIRGLVNLNRLSHVKEVVKDYKNDPLNVLGLNSRLLFGLLDTSLKIFSSPLNVDCPLYCSVGGADKLVQVSDLEYFFKNIEPKANLYIVDGAYHEMHNESDSYRRLYFNFLRQSLLGE